MSLNSCSSGGSGSGGNGSGSGCGSGGSNSGSPCGACKFLRRKCVDGCIFAPYFDSEQGPAHFAAVHKIFGASNVSKLLHNIPSNRRLDAVVSICFEAQARIKDPVFGCVAQIFSLQQQVMALRAEITYLQSHHIPTTELQMPPPPPPPQAAVVPPVYSVPDLPSTTTMAMPPMPANYDISSLFDPPPSWAVQQRAMDPRQYLASGPSPTTGGAFHAVARELAHRHGPAAPGPVVPGPAAPGPSVPGPAVPGPHGPHGPSYNASPSLSKFFK